MFNCLIDGSGEEVAEHTLVDLPTVEAAGVTEAATWLIDTSGCDCAEAPTEGQQSKSNPHEVLSLTSSLLTCIAHLISRRFIGCLSQCLHIQCIPCQQQLFHHQQVVCHQQLFYHQYCLQAGIVVQHCRALMEAGLTCSMIAVITPYNAQVWTLVLLYG